MRIAKGIFETLCQFHGTVGGENGEGGIGPTETRPVVVPPTCPTWTAIGPRMVIANALRVLANSDTRPSCTSPSSDCSACVHIPLIQVGPTANRPLTIGACCVPCAYDRNTA